MGSASRLAVLLFTDIVGSTELKNRIGAAAFAPLLERHNSIFESNCNQSRGEILKHTGDGFFASFATASDAVRAALCFQAALRTHSWDHPIAARVGIHVGEVAVMEMAGRPDVVGVAADVAARVMSAAAGGQILLTRGVFNDARQFVSAHPSNDGEKPPALRWVAHGPYLFKGIEEPIELFEVGAEGLAPLSAPPGDAKTRRVVPHDQEQTLGWRPAVGLEVPRRPGWELQRKLGEGGFGEVWLGRHERTKQRRVFKFCFDAQRLRSFKRELTLVRLLRDALGERHDVAKLYEVKLDEPPYFVESEYTEGGSLSDWLEAQGGIAKVPLRRRIEIIRRIAVALSAAHAAGVAHKDIKPGNILIHVEPDGSIQPRLSDFGIGLLTDPAALQERNITQTGFTSITQNESSRTGTRLYAPPELVAGREYTAQGDVYSLGLLLYQMIIGDLTAPLGHGWQDDVRDANLRRVVAGCVHVEPKRRTDAAHLATALAWWDRWPIRAAAGFAAAVFVIVLTMIFPAIGRWMDNDFYDLWYKLRSPSPHVESGIVVIELDDRSLTRMKEVEQITWPWPREIWGRLIQRCSDAGASVVALDIIYPDRGVPWSGDAAFIDAIRASRVPVVLASLGDVPIGITGVQFGETMKHDRRTTVRDYGPITPTGRTSFALATLQAGGGKIDIPPRILLNFGPATSIPREPITNLLLQPTTGTTLDSLRGRTVVVAWTGTSVQDEVPTPVGDMTTGLIEATALQNLLHGDHVRQLAWPPIAFLAALLVAAGSTRYRSRRGRWLAGLVVPMALIAASASAFCLGHHIYWLPIASALLACAAAGIGARGCEWFIGRWLFLQGRRRAMKATSR